MSASGVELWIPGPWKDRSEFNSAVAAGDSGVLAAGGMLVDAQHKRHATYDTRWEQQLASDMPAGLFRLLVLQVRDPNADCLSSFGMQQLGLPDGSIEDDGTDVEAAWALFEFNAYLWGYQLSLQDGHTFSRAGDGALRYRLKHGADRRYPEGHPYFNLHGVWELTPA